MQNGKPKPNPKLNQRERKRAHLESDERPKQHRGVVGRSSAGRSNGRNWAAGETSTRATAIGAERGAGRGLRRRAETRSTAGDGEGGARRRACRGRGGGGGRAGADGEQHARRRGKGGGAGVARVSEEFGEEWGKNWPRPPKTSREGPLVAVPAPNRD